MCGNPLDFEIDSTSIYVFQNMDVNCLANKARLHDL
jgi:hypothetical protein